MRQGSFVRKGAVFAADPGTRPGLHGQTLLSSGHPDLDRLLGGGLPLGSLLLVLEDGWSSHHATLLRYFLAEGAACGQSLLLAAAPAPEGGLPRFLPAQLRGRAAEKDEEEGGQEQEQYKLRIAWQYRRYIKAGQPLAGATSWQPGGLTGAGSGGGGTRGGGAGSSGSGPGGGGGSGTGAGSRKPAGLRDWCHRFDLLKPVGEEGLQRCRAELVDCGRGGDSSGDGSGAAAEGSTGTQRLLSSAASFVQLLSPAAAGGTAALPLAAAPPAAPPPRGPQHVGRIAVLSLGSLGWQLGDGSPGVASSSGSSGGSGGSGGQLARALLQLKGLVRERRCVAVVSVPAALLGPADLARLQHLADGVVALESVADDSDIARLAPDPASVAGLLHLRKLPSMGAAAPALPEVSLHIVRHKRRRLCITPVEIDPDAELADAESASGAGRSVAAALCGGPPAADRAVDF